MRYWSLYDEKSIMFASRTMDIRLLLLLVLFILPAAANLQRHLRFFEYCSYHGYPVEDHIISTQDNYNLQFYRIQAKNSKITGGKKVIYLQHGLTDSSDTWVVNDEDLAPGFYLANQGYDVWLGNSRGNRYSNKKMSPSPIDFWDFSFHQMAVYDLPAAFRYIKAATNRKIHYIGHSQGTLIMFIALCQEIKDVRDNLLSYNAFGPVAYLKHQKSKMMSTLSKTNLPSILLRSHVKWLMMLGESGYLTLSDICIISPIVCREGLKEISEMNNTVNNLKRMPVVMGHFPAGSSTKNFIHFNQFVKKEEFKNFDYGEKKNMQVYGQKTPPLYNLSKIAFPVHLYVGKYDKLADVEDSTKLFNELINSPGKTMEIYDFGHATFIWGKTLKHVQKAVTVIEAAEPHLEQAPSISLQYEATVSLA